MCGRRGGWGPGVRAWRPSGGDGASFEWRRGGGHDFEGVRVSRSGGGRGKWMEISEGEREMEMEMER